MGYLICFIKVNKCFQNIPFNKVEMTGLDHNIFLNVCYALIDFFFFFFKPESSDGKYISPFHDIPMYADEAQVQYVHLICY